MDPKGRASVYPDNQKQTNKQIVRAFHSLEIKVRTCRLAILLNGNEHLFCNYEDLSSNLTTLLPGKKSGHGFKSFNPSIVVKKQVDQATPCLTKSMQPRWPLSGLLSQSNTTETKRKALDK